MKKTFNNYQTSLFYITIAFFVLGMIHISLSLIGLLCFIIPFIQYAVYKDRIWCKYYCPRAGLMTRLLSKISLKKPLPKFLKGSHIKTIVLTYFAINLFFVTMSTLMVTLGRVSPMEFVKFLILFRLPFELPQLFSFTLHPTLMHLSYRIYSMMFTSTVIALVLGFIYMPRTWCTMCPIMTLTSRPAKKKANENAA